VVEQTYGSRTRSIVPKNFEFLFEISEFVVIHGENFFTSTRQKEIDIRKLPSELERFL
jgi:hypothetical protein